MTPPDALPLPVHPPSNALLTGVPASAQAKFSDTLDIDHERRLLFLGDNWSGGLDVFDISPVQPRFLQNVRLRGRLFGVVVAPALQKVFVGMTGSVVAVVDMRKKDPVVTAIATGGNGHVDLMDYDPESGRLFAANRLDGFLTTIDAATDAVIGRIEGLGQGLEQPRHNPRDGKVYVTDNRENVLYRIDPDGHRLLDRFDLPSGCYPNGMAIDSEANQALLVGSKEERPICVLWDLDQQSIAAVFEGSGCGDGVIHEPSVGRFLVAASCCPGGPAVSIFGGTPCHLLTTVATAPGASWVGFDRVRRRVFTPATTPDGPALLSFEMPASD